jgi:hypothetical protein
VYQFTSNGIDVDELRARLRKMTDDALLRFGRAAAYMCSAQTNYHEPRRVFVVQLEEARTQWRRRKACEDSDRQLRPSKNACFVKRPNLKMIRADSRIPGAR